MYTKNDAYAHVETALGDYADEHNIPAILDALYRENGGTWDLTDFNTERFWEIVAADGQVQPTTEMPVDATADLIYSRLAEASQRVEDARLDLDRITSERDALIIRARKAGAGATELTRLTGMSRGRIYQLLDKHGLSK